MIHQAHQQYFSFNIMIIIFISVFMNVHEKSPQIQKEQKNLHEAAPFFLCLLILLSVRGCLHHRFCMPDQLEGWLS